MAENPANAPLLSVHIMLPEGIDRRLGRRTEMMQGASWPSWGGHITLVPNFIPLRLPAEVRAALEGICAKEEPFLLCFADPVAVPDSTRPDYFAVFLTVKSPGKKEEKREEPTGGQDESNANRQGDEVAEPLHSLRRRLLEVLSPLRQDVRPQLVEGPFLPHVTLALGLSESEARAIVRKLRADPFDAEFRVEVLWLVAQTPGEPGRFERQPIPLGRISPAELLRE